MTEKEIQEGLNKAYLEAGNNAYFGDGFYAGIKFAEEKANETHHNVKGPSPVNDYEKLQNDYAILKEQYEKRGKRMKEWRIKYDLPIIDACLDESEL